jgi:diguanylate cyclase (GGDEF)-like protein/PAS domain S-box-containing protein
LRTCARGVAAIEPLSLGDGGAATVLPLAAGAALVLIGERGLESTLRDALIESRQRFKALVEISSDFAWETDAEGAFVFVSPQGALGWTATELLGRRAADFLVDPSDSQTLVFRASRPIADLDLWFRRADGGAACLGVAAVPAVDREGLSKGARGVCRDLTAERARDEALARARLRDRLMAHLVRTMRDEIEPHLALAAAVSAAGLAVGASGGVVLRRRPEGVGEEGARWGEPVPQSAFAAATESLAGAVELDAAFGGFQFAGMATRYRGATNGALLLWRREGDGAFGMADRAIVADVADQLGIAIAQVVHHERILQLSRTDGLTGLLNHRAFFEELDRRLRVPELTRQPGALIYLDLDNFKLVNDRSGHGAGDEVLKSFARILRENTRGVDLAARLGGDEFVVWIDGIDPATAESRARTIARALETLAPLTGDAARPLSVSIGLVLCPADGRETAGSLVAFADRAMYAAKRSGKGVLRLAAETAETLPA